MIDCGTAQTIIAQRIGISDAYVSQSIKKWVKNNILIRESHNHFYTLSPAAKAFLKSGGQSPVFNQMRVHHIGIKFKVLNQSNVLSKDKRTGYDHSWKPRGAERHVYFYANKQGLPSCTLIIHPGTILAWVDAGQLVTADSIEQAEHLGDLALHQATDQFIEKQKLFGTRIELDHGTQIGNRHYCGLMQESHPAAQQALKNGLKNKDWFVDKSPQDKIPGLIDIETESRSAATALEQVLSFAPQFPDMAQSIQRIEALVQGGTTSEQKVNQLVSIMAMMLEKINALEKKLENTKA